MTHRGVDAPAFDEADRHRLSRRAILRALGAGAAAVAANPLLGGVAGAQGAPTAGGSEKRAPGGPDVAQMLWDLEYDPDKIFRFVADQIGYDGYAGALRGATGALWSLAGNSVDQALLLAEMLSQSEVTVRFATGELD